MIFRMALRNILRQKRRTILTMLMMVFGYVLLSFTISLVDGGYGNIINAFTSQYTGHMQIHNQEYVERASLYKTIKNYPELIQKIADRSEVKSFAPRILSGGLAFSSKETHKKTVGVEVLGVDWELEEEATQLSLRIGEGALPHSKGEYQALLGAKVAKLLQLSIGDDFVIISQGADGSVANDLFKVSGIMNGKEPSRDDFRVYVDLTSAQEFFSLYNQIHEISVSLLDPHDLPQFIKSFNVDKSLILRSWMEVESDFYKAMRADKNGNNLTLFIIMLVVGLGVFNTVLMSILERTREFGLLKAIGTEPKTLVQLIISETLMLASTSVIIGFIFSMVLNYYFSIHGIHYPEPISYGGVVFKDMYTILNLNSFLTPAIVVLLTAIIVTLYPSYKAVKVSPIDALREF